ncbi:cell division initiation protein [Desulfohalotomaculum tongense]|uniref:DivIVA domain-containing protein n=1 Tax=Desulforadius tongensis TaxID=1216062 RepID=UPI00195E2DF0|nr:DivIVA domain-containing protein [Desulforadius tongensis]MBM7855245.1 cell division initiation protein [Desulforadius tongensis]
MLTPLDIRQKEFKKSFRGYDERQVDKFLEEAADTVEDLLKENERLKKNLAECESRHQQYRQLEEAIKETMVMAQKNAQELKENTDKEIKVLMQDAYQRSEKIIQDAEEEGKKKIAAAQAKVQEIMEEYREIQKQAQVFRAQFRTFLETQLELLAAEDQRHQKLPEDPQEEEQAG